jgi:hypothetical protein
LGVAVAIQVRAETGVKCGIVLEDYDSGFNGIDRGAGTGQNFPTGLERAANSGAAVGDRFVRNIPSAAVNDKRGFQIVTTAN